MWWNERASRCRGRLPRVLMTLVAVGSTISLHAQTPAQVAFDRLSELVGTWRAEVGEGRFVSLDLRLSAGGSGLVETWTMSRTRESLTIYTVDGDRLLVTHDAGWYHFTYLDGTGSQDPAGEHLERMATRIDGPSQFTRRETYVANGSATTPAGAGRDLVFVRTP